MGLIKEFKEFAMRGNVLDMAIGVIIGGAFGKIVSSLVEDLMMPTIGVLVGGADFSDLKVVLQEAHDDVAAVTINYGNFIQVTIDFLIVAFAIFAMIKTVNKLSELSRKKAEEVAAATPPEPSETEKLLREIRDLMKAEK